jgi:hypothetical protein
MVRELSAQPVSGLLVHFGRGTIPFLFLQAPLLFDALSLFLLAFSLILISFSSVTHDDFLWQTVWPRTPVPFSDKCRKVDESRVAVGGERVLLEIGIVCERRQ